jgi:hypothetical protein
MPLELWGLVFSHCLPKGARHYCTPSMNQPPLVLGQVCRGWRGMAFATPQLWSSVHISGSNPRFLSHLKLIKTWLARTRNLPLFISIDGSDLDLRKREKHDRRSQAQDPKWVVEGLARFWRVYSARCHNLQLCTPHDLIQGLLNDPGALLPKLESLSLHTLQKSFRDSILDPVPDIVISTSATNLRAIDLRIDGLDFEMQTFVHHQITVATLPDVHLPWDMLTRFTTSTSLGVRDCYRLFRQCPNLESCYLGRITHQVGLIPATAISLPHLRSLILMFAEYLEVQLGSLLDPLTMAAISNLELVFIAPGPYDDGPRAKVFSLLERSSPPIKRLIFYRAGRTFPENHVVEFLQRFPTLVDVNHQGRDLLTQHMLDMMR